MGVCLCEEKMYISACCWLSVLKKQHIIAHCSLPGGSGCEMMLCNMYVLCTQPLLYVVSCVWEFQRGDRAGACVDACGCRGGNVFVCEVEWEWRTEGECLCACVEVWMRWLDSDIAL